MIETQRFAEQAVLGRGSMSGCVSPLPTPGIAFITHSMRADAGVVISASHNPFQDNGIKIFGHDGFKLPDEREAELETMMASGELTGVRPQGRGIGKAHRIDDAVGRYVAYLKTLFPKELDLSGIKLVVDAGHGAAYKVAPAVFSEARRTRRDCARRRSRWLEHQ